MVDGFKGDLKPDQLRRPRTFKNNMQLPAGQPGRHLHLVRGLPLASSPRTPGRRSHRHLGGPQVAGFGVIKASSTSDGKQALVPSTYYPWAFSTAERMEGARLPSPRPGRVAGTRREDEGRRISRWHSPTRAAGGHGHVRHAQPSRQRLRLPHRAHAGKEAWDGEGQERVQDLGGVPSVRAAGRQRPGRRPHRRFSTRRPA